jgi:hypothetical protein
VRFGIQGLEFMKFKLVCWVGFEVRVGVDWGLKVKVEGFQGLG